MEETKFKDVAHLYIGCKLYFPSKNTFKLLGVLINETGTLIVIDNMPRKHIVYDSTVNFKPLLRPLSSITEIEALELGKIATRNVVENVSKIMHGKVFEWVEIYYSNETEKIHLGPELITWMECQYEPGRQYWRESPIYNNSTVILWLTQKHFDIFGLIKTREALALEN